MNESPILIHVWNVNPDHAGDAVSNLDTMLSEAAKDPGFISARVLESADGESVAVLLEMRSAEDRARFEQLPEVYDTLHNLHGTANLVIRLYHEVGVYGAP
jgi:heme-degrading monooxygenase HmoA